MNDSSKVPIAPGLFTWPCAQPQLLGSRCAGCGIVTFPQTGCCPKCGLEAMAETALATEGTLWTWTSQSFRPKPPYNAGDTEETFKTYFVGYVELPGQVMVESRLLVDDETQLKIGMPMALEIVKYRQDGEHEIMIYAFRPLSARRSASAGESRGGVR